MQCFAMMCSSRQLFGRPLFLNHFTAAKSPETIGPSVASHEYCIKKGHCGSKLLGIFPRRPEELPGVIDCMRREDPNGGTDHVSLAHVCCLHRRMYNARTARMCSDVCNVCTRDTSSPAMSSELSSPRDKCSSFDSTRSRTRTSLCFYNKSYKTP